MLHEEGAIAVLDGLLQQRIFHKAPVHEVNLIIPVGTVGGGLPQKAVDGDRRNACVLRGQVGFLHRDQLTGNLPSENGIDHIHERAVSQRQQLLAAVLQKAEGDLRVGQGLLFQNVLNPGSLGGGGF